MTVSDLSTASRIPLIMELMDSISRLTDPNALLDTFLGGMRRAYGNRGYLQLSTAGLKSGEYQFSRLITDEGVERIEPWRGTRPAAAPLYRGGVLAQAIAHRQPAIMADLDLAVDPVLGAWAPEQRSLLAVPLLDNAFGISWVVLFDRNPQAFSLRDLEELVLRANLAAAMVNNLDTAQKLAKANGHIQREMDAIARIQTSLLPESMPEMPGVKMAASYKTFDRAGGDLYDICRVGEGFGQLDERWAILIGDVSGHGPAAAVVMAMFHAIVHTFPRRPRGPGEVLSHVNRHLSAKRIEQSFVTAFLGFYDPETRELTYARAGHNPPLLKDFPHRGAPQHLDAVGEPPLGILPEVHYSEATVKMRTGQTLILYTDGITEARRPGGEMFGIEGIENSLIQCTGVPECAIDHITKALQAHQIGVRPNDDQTVLVMQMV